MAKLPKLINLTAHKQYRIIPSVYPTINFFEDLVEPDEMPILWELEGLTNERLRQEVGDIFLVPPEDRISGPGSSVVMAAFTHLSKATRFSDGTYGVYYAALSQETAIRETVFHRENFLKATNEAPAEITMRLYEGILLRPLHDVRGKEYAHLHDPNSYLKSQSFGKTLKTQNSWGIIYNSVRHDTGTCIAALRPPTVSVPKNIAHLKYIWNGHKITEVLSMQRELVLG